MKPPQSLTKIQEKVVDVIRQQLDYEGDISLASKLVDLEMDELDLMEILLWIEEAYVELDITLEDEMLSLDHTVFQFVEYVAERMKAAGVQLTDEGPVFVATLHWHLARRGTPVDNRIKLVLLEYIKGSDKAERGYDFAAWNGVEWRHIDKDKTLIHPSWKVVAWANQPDIEVVPRLND